MIDGIVRSGHDELESLFTELDAELTSAGVSLEVLMVGGAWLLWHEARRATHDVDSARPIPRQASAAIARVARRHDLDDDWVNDRAAAFLPHDVDPTALATVFEGERLTVSAPPPDTIFLMKLHRAGARDREDMTLLWPRCSFDGPDDAARRYADAYPHAPEDPHLADFIGRIAADAT